MTNGVDALVVGELLARARMSKPCSRHWRRACRCRTGSTSSTTAPPRSRWLTPTAPRSFRWTRRRSSARGPGPGFARSSRTFGRRVRLLLGGVRFKYQPVLSENPLDVDLQLASQRCDAVVVTGDKTEEQTSPLKIAQFRYVQGPRFRWWSAPGHRRKLPRAASAHRRRHRGQLAEGHRRGVWRNSATAVAEFMDAVRQVRALVAAPTVTGQECS